ncbi:MAG: hypothetical protein CMI18_10050 [Opitutaceae bacterium]|nr:hypothetical protein [Opitutaceae bacterium]
MPRKNSSHSHRSSWKKIPQRAGKKPITRESKIMRLRRMVRFIIISLSTGSLVLGLSLLGYYYVNTRKAPAIHATAASFTNIEIETDGALPSPWIESRMGLEQNLGLMQIDMRALKAELERFPQIKEASIERRFPNTLWVGVHERFPVFRIKVKGSNAESQILLVDDAGFVFRNIRFPDHMINDLPFLAGVKLYDTEKGYLPIAGVSRLAELFHIARREFPKLAENWIIVFADQLIMADSFTEGYIRVRSKSVKEILFSPKEFRKQLEKLQYILDSQGGSSVSSMTRVNLSLIDQPTVVFANNSYPKPYQ